MELIKTEEGCLTDVASDHQEWWGWFSGSLRKSRIRLVRNDSAAASESQDWREMFESNRLKVKQTIQPTQSMPFCSCSDSSASWTSWSSVNKAADTSSSVKALLACPRANARTPTTRKAAASSRMLRCSSRPSGQWLQWWVNDKT